MTLTDAPKQDEATDYQRGWDDGYAAALDADEQGDFPDSVSDFEWQDEVRRYRVPVALAVSAVIVGRRLRRRLAR